MDLEMGIEDLKEEVKREDLGKVVFAVAAAIAVDEGLVVARLFFYACLAREKQREGRQM